MKYTSAQANKLLKRLQEERDNLLVQERQSSTFVAAITEDLESARPAYDFAKTQAQLAELERRIRVIKHSINTFNCTHVVEGFDMTVDQLLIYLPQLSERKNRLSRMAMTLEKSRLTNTNRINLIEYQYANFDVAQASAEYERISEELSRAQLALDKLNQEKTMEITL